MTSLVPLARVTPAAGNDGDPGGPWAVRGLVTTSFDGSAFDAVSHWDGAAPGVPRAGGLFDLEGGGLRVVEAHVDRHEYVLAAAGEPGPSCIAAGVASPCFVPRLAALARDRLRTAGELAPTLIGRIERDDVVSPAAGGSSAGVGSKLTIFPLAPALLLVFGIAAAVTLAAARRRGARRHLVRVRAAARVALRATRGDATLAPLRDQVYAMLARAVQLDVARRACSARLAGIDRAALARRREACARYQSAQSAAPEAADALAWIAAEQAEGVRLEKALAASLLGIERSESALRVVALRVRAQRGAASGPAREASSTGTIDPVRLAAQELELRDEALREADATLLDRRSPSATRPAP
jgi:hypothetical protein